MFFKNQSDPPHFSESSLNVFYYHLSEPIAEVSQGVLGACTHLVIALFVTAGLTAVIPLLPKHLCLRQGSGEEEININLLSSLIACVQSFAI